MFSPKIRRFQRNPVKKRPFQAKRPRVLSDPGPLPVFSIIPNPGDDLLSQGGLPLSTIGAEGLNFRVRNGNGCDPLAQVTGEIESRHSLVGGSQVARAISTDRLKPLRVFHLRPINLVFSKGSSGPFNMDGISNLEAGFTLRCIQRLSRPTIAIQPCHWRDNWDTRGSSIPVLSY